MTPRASKSRSAAARQARVTAARRAAEREQRRRRQILLAGSGAALLLVATVVSVALSRNGGGAGAGVSPAGPAVGGDLHALVAVKGAVYVSGHAGAGMSMDGGRTWQQLSTLQDKDGMGWAVIGADVLVGGHGGLYRTTDGRSFAAVAGLPVSDVHGLGGAEQTLYLASPQGGVYASSDAGRNWRQRTTSGTAIMGTIIVDSKNPERLLAPDMQEGVVASNDGGRTWQTLGGPPGAMSVARNPADTREIVAVGMSGAQRSTNGGTDWTPMTTPDGVSAVTFDPSGPGRMLAAALAGDRARLYASDDHGATWTPIDQSRTADAGGAE